MFREKQGASEDVCPPLFLTMNEIISMFIKILQVQHFVLDAESDDQSIAKILVILILGRKKAGNCICITIGGKTIWAFVCVVMRLRLRPRICINSLTAEYYADWKRIDKPL